MFFNNNLLKLFYSAMLTGIPSVTYNPINNNIFHAPVVIKPFSTYINYRLNFEQYTYIKNILDSRSNNLLPIFSNTLQDENKDYYLSVNIYNCSSPIFNTITQDEVTRCEINTYVTDSKKNIGTVIMDYCSNYLSMDPVNIFKLPDNISFIYNKYENYIHGFADSANIKLSMNFDIESSHNFNKLSNDIVLFTDKIFYMNGIYDKLYYDSSLINNKIIVPLFNNISFKFFDLEFDNPSSIFYFKNEINFVGGIWYNLFEHI